MTRIILTGVLISASLVAGVMVLGFLAGLS
jgi:hypothetical protein